MNSIGVYIPAYNVEKYIIESINSILSQTFSNFEIVIIDDCSNDNTYEEALKIKDSRVKIYKREEHCGFIGKVKNEAIEKLGEHKYICHVGSDDLIPEYCFKTFIDYMEKNSDVGACCGNFICFNDKNKWTLPHVANSGDFNKETLLKYMCMFPMRFYRKSAVESVGGYSEEITSSIDYDLALKLDEKYTIHRIKEPITYYYRQHSQQVSTRARPEQDLNAKKALQDALNRRKINAIVINDAPPFKIKKLEEEHFIWGKK